MKTTTEQPCPECGAYCTVSDDEDRPACPSCSRINHDSHPPESYAEYYHHEAWQLHAAYPPERAIALCAPSLTEHAYE